MESYRYKSVAEINSDNPFGFVPFGFLASKNYLYTQVMYKSKIIQLFYSIKSKQLIYGHELINDIDAGYYTGGIAMEGNDLICLIEPLQFLERYGKIQMKYSPEVWQKFIQENKDLRTLLKTVKVDDNQIIMKCILDF